MDDERALLGAIIANPADDLPRLVYADWIEERGYPERAALIRLQIERPNAAPWSPEWVQSISETALLLARNRKRWTTEFAPYARVEAIEFSRGMPETVTLSAEEYVGAAPGLYAMAPLSTVYLCQVAIPDVPAYWSVTPAGVRLLAIADPPDWQYPEYAGAPPGAIELLRPTPPSLEPHLRCGRWEILAYNMCAERESEIARRVIQQVNGYFRDVSGPSNTALRPYSDSDEFKTWCPEPVSNTGPHWLRFENGRLVRNESSAEIPVDWPTWDEYDDSDE
ncbi:TIGR02996 domain-containing protein [Fimbriiglobus ruber]|uniref:TIGR02996 domain-containing protein n=1 Tax=Fimbriiglobus ruber TaxID=1908690 RepID=A0A225D537_9BACT|nr:TIGR02996 domain-containing protein [Fimbriiglobus ruber]OWK36711.1 hypothetical protein FRUB_09274 [Fimbriiglobus ruber]